LDKLFYFLNVNIFVYKIDTIIPTSKDYARMKENLVEKHKVKPHSVACYLAHKCSMKSRKLLGKKEGTEVTNEIANNKLSRCVGIQCAYI
jgi:hypothetical protein